LDPPTSAADLVPGEKGEPLTLSTVHSAKGLEWSVVFIIWVMEGRFPPSRAYVNPPALEEERRMMYVAATRAKDQLIMCYPGQESLPSWQFGETGYRNGMSSLIRGLPEDVINHESTGMPQAFPEKGRQSRDSFRYQRNCHEPSGLSQGDKVNHPAFGPGIVSKLIAGDKVEVLFRNAGRKLLHLEYTTLVRI
jgi:DNA helicase-2/ATP-dependent DNA helicase PcrA